MTVSHVEGTERTTRRRRPLPGWLRRILSANSSRARLFLENEAFALTVPAGSLVLDAGAGDAPYKPLFSHARYESADFEKIDKPYAQTTYVCDLRQIPVEDARFDAIIFNQVMEHVPELKLVLLELSRVLKPGGRLIYSAPLYFEEHEQPYDFFRYTQFGVRYLFESAGFVVDRLEWLEGYYATVSHQMRNMSKHLPSRPSDVAPGILGFVVALPIFILRLQMAALCLCFHWLEMRKKVVGRGHPKNMSRSCKSRSPECHSSLSQDIVRTV